MFTSDGYSIFNYPTVEMTVAAIIFWGYIDIPRDLGERIP